MAVLLWGLSGQACPFLPLGGVFLTASALCSSCACSPVREQVIVEGSAAAMFKTSSFVPLYAVNLPYLLQTATGWVQSCIRFYLGFYSN